jgi:hypothetical protein
MQAAALKIAIVVVAACCAAGVVGHTISAFSSTTANSASTFATKASFYTCPNQTVTGGYTTGLEYGRLPYSGDSLFAQGTGVSVDGTVARTGGYSMKVAAAGAAGHAYLFVTPAQPTQVVRFALRLNTLPTANVQQLMSMTAGNGASLHLRYVAASQKLAVAITGATGGTPVVATADTTVTAGAWQVVEIRYAVGTATHAAAWQIDEANQPGATVAAAATSISQTYLGTRVTDTFTAHYDDILTSSNGAQYPLGDGRVRALSPNGMGTHVGAASFQDNDGTPIDATSWQRLDEIPLNTTNDFIQIVTPGGLTNYAEITLADTTETCIRSVHGYISIHSTASQANVAKLSIFDGSTESVIKTGNFSANNTLSRDGAKPVTPASSWTQSAVNGLVARFGYSNDFSPAPILDGVLVEYEIPQ